MGAAQPPPGQSAGHVAPGGASTSTADTAVLFDGSIRHSAKAGAYLRWTLVTVVLTAVGAWATTLPVVRGWPLWAAGLIGVAGLIWTYLLTVTTRYKVTSTRVEFERGVLSRDVDSIELWRVLDVRFRQSLLDRMLGHGKIVLLSTDRSHGELVLYGLPQPRVQFERLRDAVHAARRQGGAPTEFVGGSPA